MPCTKCLFQFSARSRDINKTQAIARIDSKTGDLKNNTNFSVIKSTRTTKSIMLFVQVWSIKQFYKLQLLLFSKVSQPKRQVLQRKPDSRAWLPLPSWKFVLGVLKSTNSTQKSTKISTAYNPFILHAFGRLFTSKYSQNSAEFRVQNRTSPRLKKDVMG